MELSTRLRQIASYVVPGRSIVDIGTDHAHLPIYLVQQGIVPGGIAADVNQGPLDHARENIGQYGLDSCIETRLSDGLAAIRPGEGQTLIIAGMGGMLMRRILQDGRETAVSMDTWILEPQSDMEKVREWIYQTGYHITAEEMVQEEGKYYPIMRAERGEAPMPSLAELRFGPVLLRDQNPMLQKALDKEAHTLHLILEGLEGKETENALRCKQEKQEELQVVQEAMTRYEM